jgi:hypothetical protein
MFIIRNTSNKILREGNFFSVRKILFFQTEEEARRYILENCGNSPYLRSEKWKK